MTALVRSQVVATGSPRINFGRIPCAAAQYARVAAGRPLRIILYLILVIRVGIPVLRPFEDVTAHVERRDPALPCWITADWLCAGGLDVSFGGIPPITPGIDRRVRSARGVFAFGLRRQPSATPTGVGLSFIPGNAHAWLLGIGELDVILWPFDFVVGQPLPAIV